jgi:hypothetical protein
LTRDPIFILGPHKSGTSLVRSLLDGTAELFVVPFEMHFFQYANKWVDYRLRKSRPPQLDLEEIRQSYIQHGTKVNTRGGRMGDSDLRGMLDVTRFKETMEKQGDSLRDLILLYVKASYAALHGEDMPESMRFVEKSVEQAEFAIHLSKMFPKARFVHVVRNPYSNIVSIRRYMRIDGAPYPFLGPALRSLENSYYNLYRNRELLGETYHVVRYEDLLSTPEGTVEAICEAVGIRYSEGLLQPTSMGQRWEGNSSRGLKFKGISAKNLNLWKKEITHLEVHLVNRLFPFVLREYGYRPMKPSREFLWPVSGERPKGYVLNRLIPYYH